MNYTVSWLPDAEAESANVRVNSHRRAEVTRAAAELDRRLADYGPEEGESRPGGRRITFVKPVSIIFRVYEETKTVPVTQVWEYR